MRVSQIQNLTWTANVLVLAGLGWVGWQFWVTHKQKPSLEWKWPEVKASVGTGQGPKPLDTYQPIWSVPISGKVPPPPEPPKPPEVKKDRWAEFQGKLAGVSGFQVIGDEARSIARLNYAGKDISVKPGSEIGGSGFQLTKWTLTKNADRSQTMSLVFHDLKEGVDRTKDVVIPPPAGLVGTGEPPVRRPSRDGFVGEEVPEKGPLDATAYQDPVSHEWIIPEAEQDWLDLYGEKNILAQVPTKPDVDAQGVSHGLRILGRPEAGAPALAASHGINEGDTIRSINGTRVTSKEEILNYLRGPGKGLTTYSVVVDYNGKERTVVYRVSRATRRSPRDAPNSPR
jgi:hypothetical protein